MRYYGTIPGGDGAANEKSWVQDQGGARVIYYEDGKGRVTGRLYEAGSGWVAEVGAYNPKSKFCKFFATKSVRFKKFRQAEQYLYANGCAMTAIA